MPSHDWPFTGVIDRLSDLNIHHKTRLNETMEACQSPVTALELQNILFKKELDNHQLFFALGESLAHAHYLIDADKLVRKTDSVGVHRFLCKAT